MPTIFGRFSKQLEAVLLESQKIGETVGRPVQSDLVVLALTNLGNAPVAELLKSLGANYTKLFEALSPLPDSPSPLPGQSQEMTLLLEESIKLAARYHFSFVEVEHLLYIIASDTRFLGHHLLVSAGLNPAAIVARIGEWMASISAMQSAKDQNNKAGKGEAELEKHTTDLTMLAEENLLDPVIGRERELEQLIHVLLRRRKNNPLLLGEPGVGKTALVDALAKRIAAGNVPEALLGKRVLTLDLSQVVAGTMYRGQFEERLKNIIDEVTESNRYILFLDEIHTLTGTGSSEGGFDAANILKPALARGTLSLIGATTFEEYRKHIRKDKALDRRFQTIQIDEPKEAETLRILKGVKPELEKHHKVRYSLEALKAAVELSVRYVTDRFLPDKAIDVLDEAATYHARENPILQQLIQLDRELEQLERQKIEAVAVANQESEWKKAEQINQEINSLKAKMDVLEAQMKDQGDHPLITAKDVSVVISNRTGIPLDQVMHVLEPVNMASILLKLKKHILGQDEAMERISQTLMRAQLGLKDEQKPMGSFLLVGPTGVGKTETARVLAREIFGDEQALIKVDMSEYMERHNVSNLIGAPAGYVGFEQGGQLTEQVWRRPFSVVLFDEVEKAHPDVFNLLLQILEDGMLTDNAGRVTSFAHCIVIMTSNIGMDSFDQVAQIGFSNQALDQTQKTERLREHIEKELEDYFKPELLGRLSGIIYFNPLSEDVVQKLFQKELKTLANRLKKQSVNFKVDQAALTHLKTGFEPNAGARGIFRQIQATVEPILINHLLKDPTQKDLLLTVKQSKLVVESVNKQ